MNAPTVKDLVLVGGGHSHLDVLKKMGMHPVDGLRVTLVTREVHTPYSGMLPGLVAGHYDFDESHIDLRPLCEFGATRLYHDTVTGIDLQRRRLQCAERPPVSFDLVSFDIGSTPSTAGVPGAAEFTTPVKPISGFLKVLDDFVDGRTDLGVAVVGGGAGGVELSLSLRHRLEERLDRSAADPTGLEIELFSASDRLLPNHHSRVGQKFSRILAERRIRIHQGCAVVAVEAGPVDHSAAVTDAAGRTRCFDLVIWATHASAPDWIGESGLETDPSGFIAVDEYLKSTSHPFVFAAGDVASMRPQRVEKSGVHAVRQGKPLAKNLRRTARGGALTKYRPQKSSLSLIGAGDRYAVGSRGPFSFEGQWVWRLKEWIDRRWMQKWTGLPLMDDHDQPVDGDLVGTDDALSAAPMRCGGCGSKLGRDVLTRVLDRLDTPQRDDVRVGLGAPDDSAVIRVPEGTEVVQTVDFFRSFIDDPYTFGRIAANHSLGDIWAMGATAQSAVAIAVVPYSGQDKVEADLYQLLAGACEVLDDAGAALVGGHSGEGAELSFGLQVNGSVAPDDLLRKGKMGPSEALVVTKPVGTGALMAANMRHQARGGWIEAALTSMNQSSRAAADCLMAHGATACTDVTGFGVLGHLVEMARPSGVDVTIDLDRLPVLDGAVETVAAGITSSLQPDNLRQRRAIANLEQAAAHPLYPLIFDPQTAGGLLASVPANRAEACLKSLQDRGYGRAAIIGSTAPASGGEPSVHVEPSDCSP